MQGSGEGGFGHSSLNWNRGARIGAKIIANRSQARQKERERERERERQREIVPPKTDTQNCDGAVYAEVVREDDFFVFFSRSSLTARRSKGTGMFYWAASRHRLFLYRPVSRCAFAREGISPDFPLPG